MVGDVLWLEVWLMGLHVMYRNSTVWLETGEVGHLSRLYEAVNTTPHFSVLPVHHRLCYHLSLSFTVSSSERATKPATSDCQTWRRMRLRKSISGGSSLPFLTRNNRSINVNDPGLITLVNKLQDVFTTVGVGPPTAPSLHPS